MSRFRDETNIETKYHACPICKGDVKGNEVYKYFCSKCNILFRSEDLIMTSEGLDKLLKEKIVEKFSSNPEAIKIEDKILKVDELTDKQKEILSNRKKTIKKPKIKKESKKKSKKETKK